MEGRGSAGAHKGMQHFVHEHLQVALEPLLQLADDNLGDEGPECSLLVVV